MTFENLLIERDGAVAVVTLNRPAVLNALNAQTLAELAAVMAELKGDAGVRAVVLTGAGEKSFVAGADINELAVLSPVEGKERARHGQQIFDAIEQLGKPVIAATHHSRRREFAGARLQVGGRHAAIFQARAGRLCVGCR